MVKLESNKKLIFLVLAMLLLLTVSILTSNKKDISYYTDFNTTEILYKYSQKYAENYNNSDFRVNIKFFQIEVTDAYVSKFLEIIDSDTNVVLYKCQYKFGKGGGPECKYSEYINMVPNIKNVIEPILHNILTLYEFKLKEEENLDTKKKLQEIQKLQEKYK